MSFNSVEISEYAGQLTEYFRIEVGATVYRYVGGTRSETLATGNPTIDGTYVPLYPISIGELQHTRDAKSLEVGITVPRDTPVAAQFITTLPDQKFPITVYRKHQSDPEVISWFSGTILSCEFQESTATLTCRPVLGGISKEGLPWRYQVQCNLQFGSARCGIDVADYTSSVTVTSLAALSVTVSGIPATDINGTSITTGYYNGGYIQTTDGSRRFITDHTGNVMSLLTPFRTGSIAVTNTVSIVAGDDHTHTTCRTKFLNIANFLGFFTIPVRNIFTQGGLTRGGSSGAAE